MTESTDRTPAQWRQRVLQTCSEWRYDAMAFAGYVAVLHGLAAIYRPAAYIIGGLAAVVYAIYLARGSMVQRALSARTEDKA